MLTCQLFGFLFTSRTGIEMSSETSVSLWVKAEPFSYGAFHIAPHPRLNFNVSIIAILLKNKTKTLTCKVHNLR